MKIIVDEYPKSQENCSFCKYEFKWICTLTNEPCETVDKCQQLISAYDFFQKDNYLG